ncbi:pyrophosphate--fructose-6-phosphate 1-phosphotransferase [Desulfocicer vacuolatum DSM 3385]|uniref:Pyrophosphate--fructose-6-phosphate 1-phosphotransferase n=1 Tax=Desulfocicer vacuolatum DSM 3385 TaxID=1121400 RepID=A0A1W2CFC3_9BACT|nr:6-phosphofructokinase [Desulfocicer vacuolatum]SMC83859.1 pyrophosphate--fructose-6-phosphate 1-phosphotransferase [Desulfocicer vacuolatum DSM 3385]
MTHMKKNDLDLFLNRPEIARVIADVSKETESRRSYKPRSCKVFNGRSIALEPQEQYQFSLNKEALKELPDIIDNHVQKLVQGPDSPDDPHNTLYGKKRHIGIVFSGGPAPGGHNAIAGVFDAAKKANPHSKVFGFILGPDGILENRYVEITADLVDTHRNMGGFTMIKTGRSKIDSPEKMKLSRQACKKLGLDALIIVGGDDSNTNAAFMAQELKADGIQVLGIPKTIDGDIQVTAESGETLCAISFGFHSAARAFSQNISNLCTDAGSDLKYWHVCKVMGRVASHLALESALQTHANITLIGEDLADYVDQERIKAAENAGTVDYTAYGITLRHLSRLICDVIVRRAAHGKNYGVMIIPEGVLEFINEIQIFIIKLNTIIGDYNHIHDVDFHAAFPSLDAKLDYLRRLSRGISDKDASPIWNARDDELFNDLPTFFQEGLLVERDTHGNFQFSQVKTEKIIMDMVKDYLDILKEKGTYKVGIDPLVYRRFMADAGLDAHVYGEVLFKNYGGTAHLLVKHTIISMKTLKLALEDAGLLSPDGKIPGVVETIYQKSVPNFKTQNHFYGYDGRGSNPTRFDCNYTYNLGLTAFGLIANGATGQMAVIRNLEHDMSTWEPLGVPIARLMHLEERKGKLALVMEKRVVELDSTAFQVVKDLREEWLAAGPGEDHYRKPCPIAFSEDGDDNRPITLTLNAVDLP